MAEIYSLHGERLSPLDRVERLANAREWFVDRAGDDEVNMIVAAQWGDLTVSLNWRDDVESLHIACSFGVHPKCGRREEDEPDLSSLLGLAIIILCPHYANLGN